MPDTTRRIVITLGITWLPLLFLSLTQGTAFGHRETIPFLYDLSMYGRFWLALPLLIVAESVIDPAIRMTITEFVRVHVVPDGELKAFESVLQRTGRLRDSWIPEFSLLVLAFFPAFLFQ